MAAVSDHERRDALHAAYSEVRIITTKYERRMLAKAKAHIEQGLVTLEGGGGTALGREAARVGCGAYLSLDTPEEALELEAPAGSQN